MSTVIPPVDLPDVPERGRRLTPDERRNQLVAAGLELAKSGPVTSVTAIEVANRAGVSKGLVFHYFPTQTDLHTAVARAGADELRALLAQIDTSLSRHQQLAQGLSIFIGYMEQQPNTFAAFARNANADPRLNAVSEETRNGIVEIIAAALGVKDLPPRSRLFLRGWIAMVEEMTLDWFTNPAIERDELIDVLVQAAFQFLAWATARPS